MKLYRLFALSLLCAILLCAGGCSKTLEATGPSEPSKAASSTPQSASSREEKVSASSSAPVSSGEETSVPSESSEEEEEKNEYLPETDTGNEQFKKAFSGNAIDRQFELEYSSATSSTLLISACSDATERWKAFVDSAFEEVLSLSSETQAASIKASQEEWYDTMDERLSEIQEQAAAEGGALEAARGVMLFYRDRAVELSYIHYTLAGTLPSFPVILPESGAMG